MRQIIIADIKNEPIKKLFENFFSAIQSSLEIKDKNKSFLKKRLSDQNLRNCIQNKQTLKFNYFKRFIENLQALEKNIAYLETTEWKVLGFLSPNLIHSQNPSAVYEALDHMKKSEFFGENNFSIIKVASIIYSLSQSDSFDAAKMLVRLSDFDLLTEQNLSKIVANRKHDNNNIILFANVLNKLSLSGGINHLLTQVNLEKLLNNPDLDLNLLAKLIEAEDKSKILTQEKFDLAISLKNLLTLENVNKIETAAFDTKKLADVISLLDKANILTQENFDLIKKLSNADFVNLFEVLSKFSDSNILNQEHFTQFLQTYHEARAHDQKNCLFEDSSTDGSSNSLVNRLCTAFLRVKKLTKGIFEKIIEFFNKKINLHNEKQAEVKLNFSDRNSNSFFPSPCRDEAKNIDTKIQRANLVNTR